MKSIFVAVAAAAALAVWSTNGRSDVLYPGWAAEAPAAIHMIYDI